MQGRIVGGIDEAGLGPLLGPLTLGLCVLRCPVEGSASEWQRLASAVTRRPDKDARRLVVADSKVVFARNPRGRARLERTVLAFLGARGAAPPGCVEDLYADAPAELQPAPVLLEQHPWYAHLPRTLPVWSARAELAEHGARLTRALERAGIELLAAFPRLVSEGELNRSFAETDNKSITTWRLCADLIAWFWETYGEYEPELVVDRQGGRLYYAALLWEHLPDTWIETRGEGRGGCEYVVHGRGRRMRVLLRERAEDSSFAVALASCIAKYLRELAMEGFNAYFRGLQEDLRPTAGYVSDARRWLEEADPALRRAGLARERLVRER